MPITNRDELAPSGQKAKQPAVGSQTPKQGDFRRQFRVHLGA